MDTTPKFLIEDEVFSMEEIEIGGKRLANGKTKDIEGYQAKILKIGGPIDIPHIHKLFNLTINHGFPKPSMQSLIVPIIKSGDKNNLSNFRAIMISPILTKLYRIVLENNIRIWIEIHGKKTKGQDICRSYHSTVDHLVTFRIITKKCLNNKTISFVVLLTLKNILT
jgi:hypothetical protein